MNMSFGTAPADSYVNDPLCQAVRRAFNAGIVVVVAAGNNGKDDRGNKMYGSINSPGIEPSAITVGAANSLGTDYRVDDTIASYSSKGPTRGFKVVNGVKKYDNLIKPDLVAPGNKLISAISNSSRGSSDSIVYRNPTLDTRNSSKSGEGLMYMSGSSMAAPLVSGAVAMMLQANPNLTPNLVKATLMYTAQQMNGYNSFEQGAGLLNIDDNEKYPIKCVEPFKRSFDDDRLKLFVEYDRKRNNLLG
jgi:subtilisin family serine protease